MATLRVPVKPTMLAWALERAGREPAGLEHRFPRLDQWLGGEVQPTLKQLEDFARATHAPLGYFFLAQPPDEPVPIPDFRTMAGKGGGDLSDERCTVEHH